jgi:glycosyltransferase involved in cell wall biosynthesis
MTILHLCTFQKYGGAAMAARRMMQAMRRAGMGIEMLVHKPEFDELHTTTVADTWFRTQYNKLLFVLDRLHFLWYEKNKSVRFAFSPAIFGYPVHRRSEVAQADVLHFHWTSFGFMNIEVFAKFNKPIVWTIHDMWLFTGGCHYSGDCQQFVNSCGNCTKYLRNPSPNDLSNAVWQRKKQTFQNLRQVIVSPSHWLAAEAHKSSLLKDADIRVIPYAIDAELFKPKNKTETRRSLQLPINKTLVLFAAAKVSDERKGFMYFVEALKTLKQTHEQDIEVVVMGGKMSSQVQELIPYPIHATGHLSDERMIANVYAAADVFVIASLEDNLPNTVIESLACGTPVVGFEAGGVPEMIDHHHNGYVAQYRSSNDLAKGIAWVLNHQKPSQLSQNARQKALDTYAEKVVAAQYEAIYASVCCK